MYGIRLVAAVTLAASLLLTKGEQEDEFLEAPLESEPQVAMESQQVSHVATAELQASATGYGDHGYGSHHNQYDGYHDGYYGGEHHKSKKGHHDHHGYKGHHHGDHGHKDHKGYHDNGGKYYKGHDDNSKYYGDEESAKKGGKGHHYGSDGYHDKGHKNGGHKNVYHHEEAYETKQYYEDYDEQTYHDKYDDFDSYIDAEAGKHRQGHKGESDHYHDEEGKKGHLEIGKYHDDHEGEEGHYEHGAHKGHKEDYGEKGGEKGGYGESEHESSGYGEGHEGDKGGNGHSKGHERGYGKDHDHEGHGKGDHGAHTSIQTIIASAEQPAGSENLIAKALPASTKTTGRVTKASRPTADPVPKEDSKIYDDTQKPSKGNSNYSNPKRNNKNTSRRYNKYIYSKQRPLSNGYSRIPKYSKHYTPVNNNKPVSSKPLLNVLSSTGNSDRSLDDQKFEIKKTKVPLSAATNRKNLITHRKIDRPLKSRTSKYSTNSNGANGGKRLVYVNTHRPSYPLPYRSKGTTQPDYDETPKSSFNKEPLRFNSARQNAFGIKRRRDRLASEGSSPSTQSAVSFATDRDHLENIPVYIPVTSEEEEFKHKQGGSQHILLKSLEASALTPYVYSGEEPASNPPEGYKYVKVKQYRLVPYESKDSDIPLFFLAPALRQYDHGNYEENSKYSTMESKASRLAVSVPKSYSYQRIPFIENSRPSPIRYSSSYRKSSSLPSSEASSMTVSIMADPMSNNGTLSPHVEK